MLPSLCSLVRFTLISLSVSFTLTATPTTVAASNSHSRIHSFGSSTSTHTPSRIHSNHHHHHHHHHHDRHHQIYSSDNDLSVTEAKFEAKLSDLVTRLEDMESRLIQKEEEEEATNVSTNVSELNDEETAAAAAAAVPASVEPSASIDSADSSDSSDSSDTGDMIELSDQAGLMLGSSVGGIALGGAGCASDQCRDTMGLAQAYNYNIEKHTVDTDDCYTLTLFRLTGQSSAPISSTPKPVVFLQHGVLDSSDTWLLNGPSKSLGFILSDAGFDVWMGNTRGNVYSRASKCSSPDAWLFSSYWNFSFDQMAEFDFPAMVNYVLQQTGQPQLVFAAHSQGATSAIANFCAGKSIQSKISAFIALGPVFHLTHSKSLLLQALGRAGVDKLVSLIGLKEFLPSNAIFKFLLPAVCGATPSLCEGVIYLLTGFDKANFDASRIQIYMSHFPAGVSVRELVHYAQSLRSSDGLVRKYDLGLIQNYLKYGSTSSPVYDVTTIDAPPTYLFYGGKDDLGDTTDVELLISEYPPAMLKKSVLNPEFGHLDFVWTESLIVYDQVVQIAKQYAGLP